MPLAKGLAWSAAGAVVALPIVVALVLQDRAEALAASLCARVGGLIVTGAVAPDRPLTETYEAVFAADDPLLRPLQARATDVRAIAWPGSPARFRPCLNSVLCLAAAQGNGRTYLDLSAGRSRALVIGSASPAGTTATCRPASGQRARRITAYFAGRGVATQVCQAAPRDLARAMVSGPPIRTLASPNPFGRYLQAHSWRVLPLDARGGSDARSGGAIGLTEIGVQTLAEKLSTAFGYLFGIRADYRRNRCSLDPTSHPGADLTADTYFLPSHAYPPGRYRNDGIR